MAAATGTIGVKALRPTPVRKRTSIGGRMTPLNKQERRSFKRYRGQGRP
jgi:hypothetical protein